MRTLGQRYFLPAWTFHRPDIFPLRCSRRSAEKEGNDNCEKRAGENSNEHGGLTKLLYGSLTA